MPAQWLHKIPNFAGDQTYEGIMIHQIAQLTQRKGPLKTQDSTQSTIVGIDF